MTNVVALGTLLLMGCVSTGFEDSVQHDLELATISVNTAEPAELASIAVRLRLETGNKAREVVLGSVEIFLPDPDDPYPVIDDNVLATLELEFPASFEAMMGSNQSQSVDLLNAATTNSDLTAYCDQSLWFRTAVTTKEKPGESSLGIVSGITIACP